MFRINLYEWYGISQEEKRRNEGSSSNININSNIRHGDGGGDQIFNTTEKEKKFII